MPAENLLRDASHHPSEPAVSVILTVVNEQRHIEAAVQAILDSNYSGQIEIAIAVGPSQDSTEEIVQSLAKSDSRIKFVPNPSGRTPDGLNAALAATTSEIIVRVDGHSEISRDYIRIAVRTLEATGAVNVGGIMAAEGRTLFERAVARAMRSKIGVGSSKFHTGGEAGSVDTVYLGSFRRSAIQAVGGYDPRFTRAQDWELNYRLRENGGLIWFEPELTVTYRPRSHIKSLAKQYFEYGRWRRAVSRLHNGTSNLRYLAPPLNLIAQLASVALALISPLFLIIPACYLLAITLSSLWIGKNWSERAVLPLVLIIMHFSWGFGFITSPRGLISN
jgi:succinoglycan biosynthesis protein ExoA